MSTSELATTPLIDHNISLKSSMNIEDSLEKIETEKSRCEKNGGKTASFCKPLLAIDHGWIVIIASFICIMTISANGLPFIFKYAYLEPKIRDAYIPVNKLFDKEVDLEIFHQVKELSELQASKEKKTIENIEIVNGLFCHLIGPGVSALIVKFGFRPVCIAGSVVSCFAFILSSISTNASVLILTYGVIGGIGFGMIYLPALVIVGHYFDTEITLASVIAFYGSEVALWVFNPLAHNLYFICNWVGYNLALSCLVLICALCGVFLRPLEFPKEPSPCFLKSNSKKTICAAIFDLELLKSPTFLIICIGNLFAMASFYIPTMYLSNYFDRDYENYRKAKSAMNSAIKSVGVNVIVRLVIGCLAYFNHIRTFVLHNMSLLIAAITVIELAICDSYWPCIISAHFFVLSISAFFYLTPSVLINLQGREKFTNAFGWILFFRGLGTIIGLIYAQELYDVTKSPQGPLYLSSALFLISSVISSLALILHSYLLWRGNFKPWSIKEIINIVLI